MAKVSVVMPIYNAERYVEKAIRSLVKQTYKDMDIILVDDGSTDMSPSIIKRMMDTNNRIKMCSQPHSGIASARNLGFKLVNSEYVLFVDADDWVEQDFVEQHLKAIESSPSLRFTRTPDCSIASGYYITIAGKEEKLKKLSPEKLLLFKSPAVWLRMFKADFLRKNEIKFGDYAVGEDLNFTGKVHLLTNPKFVLTGKALYHYHIRPGSAVGTTDEKQFQLLDAVRDLEKFAKDNDVYEQNKSFLEYMVINHVLMAGMKRAGEGKLLQAIDKIINFVDELHPQWYENRFIEMYTDDEEKKYLEAVRRMDRKAIIKFASHY